MEDKSKNQQKKKSEKLKTCSYDLLRQKLHNNEFHRINREYVDINVVNERGRSLLFEFCQNKHIDILRLLIENQIDVNLQDEDGNTILHYIICYNHEISKLMIDAGADINIRNKKGESAIDCIQNELADNYEYEDICEDEIFKNIDLIISLGLAKKIELFQRCMLLYYTISQKRFDVAEKFINTGMDLNQFSESGFSYMDYNTSSPEIVRFLIDNGFNVNTIDGLGHSQLFRGINNGNSIVIKMLIENGATLVVGEKEQLKPEEYSSIIRLIRKEKLKKINQKNLENKAKSSKDNKLPN